MAKFNSQTRAKAVPPTTGRKATSFIATELTASGQTGNSAPGFARDTKGELFLLAVANIVGESTFYEKAGDRDVRFQELVRVVAVQDSEWLTRFLGWLRTDANMRSASVVGALEAARAMVQAKIPGSRSIVDSVLQRADEPGEALAYWIQNFGRSIPKPVKRGIADAAERMYTEYGLLKYDTASKGFRFADVLDLTHAQARAPWQRELYKYALDRRHGREDIAIGDNLSMIRSNASLRQAAVDNPQALLDAEALKAAGMTWEDALSLVGSKVNKSELWEALIPSMGYMALLRNLRNFDEAGVSDKVGLQVAARIADAAAVAKSRQFPFRFLAAHRAVSSLRWAHALDVALNASLANVPALGGKTLILVDLSGSMYVPSTGQNSDLSRADAAKIFGSALALQATDPTLVWFSESSGQVKVPKGGSVLKLVESFPRAGGGTGTALAVQKWSAGMDRVIVLTDEQANWHSGHSVFDSVPASVPTYTWNLAGYRFGQAPTGTNRHTFGGLVDVSFKLIPLLERGDGQTWPF